MLFISETVIFPSVKVPVLSNMIRSIFILDSMACGPLINKPKFAALPVPTKSAVGVANPRAHGQAITRTAIAEVKAIVELF